jgi:hypothetical protein
MLLNSNVPGNTTDATGYIGLTKQGSGSIDAAPAFLTPQSINLASSATSLSYGQTATLTPSGFSGTGARTYNTSGGCTVTGNTLTAGPPGTCTVSVTIAADTTYKAATSLPISITQIKASQATFTASQVTSSATWNGSAFTATPGFSTIGGSDTGAVTYTVANGTATGCSLSNATASAVLTASTLGTCTITATKAATTNYDAAASTLTFTFTQATTTSTLAIQNTSVTYGTAVTLTATVSPSTATGTFSFSNNGTPITGCTSVAITSGTATCSTWKPAVGTYTSQTATYSGSTNVLTSTSLNSISFEITPAPLTITASSPTVIYGAGIPEITPSYSGFVNSETSAVVTGVACSTAYTTSSNVGSLPATSCNGGSASNYQIFYTNGAVTINKAAPTISVALPAGATAATYGTPVVVTVTVSIPGAVTFKSGGVAVSGCTSVAATATATCTWTPSAFNANTVLTADFLPTDSTNYSNLTAAGSSSINVGKATLNITASSHTVAFGSSSPTITASYSGLLNGDTSAVVTGLTCTTTYTTTTSVGNTGSSCSGGIATDYTITYTAGVVTITQGGQTSALTITSITGTYGATLSLTTSGGDGAGSNSFVVNSGPCSVSGTTLSSTAAGICMVTATKAANGNYLAATSSSTAITIGKATPTFSSWSDVSKAFENGDFTLTAPSVTGSLAGTFTYASATPTVISLNDNVATVAGAGTSVITATFTPTDSSNYNNVTTSMTVTVAKVSPRFSTVNVSKAFGSAPFSLSNPYVFRLLTGTFTFSSADTSVVTLSGRIATVVGVGTSVITATFTPDDTNNYLTGATATFSVTVTQGAQTNALSISSTSVTYGSTLSLATTGGDGLGTISFVLDSGTCTLSGVTLTPTAAGTCMVTATKSANGNYLAASSNSTAITVAPKDLMISGLTGVNKEFDGTRVGSTTGSPSLVGIVGSDNVLLGGTPVFTFSSPNVANGITLVSSGYTLTETSAANYTLTQPTLTANITAKAARVAANNVTVAFGAAITSGVTASGLISPDTVGSASYTYSGTGTSTPPTTEGVYTVTPSSVVLDTGLIGNYSFSYDTATVIILAKYTITYNANGGLVSGASTANVDFIVGGLALTHPTPSRANYTFIGWFTLQNNGAQATGPFLPTATSTLWARWVQNSLYGMGSNTKIFSLTTLSDVGNYYQADAAGGTVSIQYLANALPPGTVIDAYLLSDTVAATNLIGANNTYVMSLVLAWVATDGTVPTTATNKAIIMTITNSVIRKGAKIYSIIGENTTLLGTAIVDGSALISITDDPQIIIANTKPDVPTGVSATSGGDSTSTVTWTTPSDGGSAITSYTVTSNAGQTCSSATTSCSITGLTNGTPYTFTVTATNAIGTSDPSSASSAATPAAPVVTPPSSGGGGGGGGYIAPTSEPTPTVDPSIAAAAAAAAKALADAKAAGEKAAAEAKIIADSNAAEMASLLAQIKALQEKADAESLAAANRLKEELAVAQLKTEEALKAAAVLKLAEEQRIAAERAAAAKKISTVYSLTSAFKLNTTYTKRLNANTKKIAAGSTVTCIGYAKSSKTLIYAKAKVVATKQAKALCSSMKKINPSLKTKSIVYPASKAPKTTVNKKWIPVSYRIESPVN